MRGTHIDIRKHINFILHVFNIQFKHFFVCLSPPQSPSFTNCTVMFNNIHTTAVKYNQNMFVLVYVNPHLQLHLKEVINKENKNIYN